MLALILCGCFVQSEKCIGHQLGAQASHFSLQTPKTHARPQSQLDEGLFVTFDDATQAQSHERRSGVLHRYSFAWFKPYPWCILAGLAYLFTCIFHGSSSPTYGLLRIVTFLLHMDGKKERLSLSVIA
jgi:hypothetical protein